MKYLFLHLLILGSISLAFGQTSLEGVWKGFIQKNGKSLEASDVFYLDIKVKEQSVTGRSRIELLDKDVMAFKSFEGQITTEGLKIEEDYVRNSTDTRKAPTCKLRYNLYYIDTTRYLKGEFKSTDCRGISGNVVLYRTDEPINEDKTIKGTHLWKHRFIEKYKKGYPSPEVLKLEQKNFKFQPIYFDHDKSEIRPVHFDYLNRMARILGGIHDLRVKVTGHTDAVGTDEYNIGLSERRAQAIKDYFKKQGIEPEKLEIDFKGERQPVDSNKTPDGKQRNRRVDFEFI